ncbi:polyketide synthase [Orbilia brochopaga]|uniref:Polyketide synthase n=1 Tax=Orbilia brochopaga TaxID=3140254 RepID=A0AAV9V2H3_9PEZI
MEVNCIWFLVSNRTSSLLVHPAVLDNGFQAVFASAGFGSGVRVPYLPTRIERMRINALVPEMQGTKDLEVTIDAYTTDVSAPSKNVPPAICTDVDLFCGDHLRIQVEGLSISAITGASSDSSNDLRLFHQTVWGVDISSGMVFSEQGKQISFVEATEKFHEIFERLAHVFLRDLFAQTPKEKIQTFQWYHQRIFEWMEDTFSSIDNGQHPFIRREWSNDTRDMLLPRVAEFSDTVDCQAMHAVYENFPAVLEGKSTMLDVLNTNNMLNRFFDGSIDPRSTYLSLAEMVKRIAHRYPHIRVLEVGAGTGATTSRILDAIDGAFSWYTYTDISSGFFEKSEERFGKHTRRMEFKTFDVKNDPVDQGFQAHTYDVIVASSVLHATPCLRETLTNVRSLLKPGGYLIMLEPTGSSLRLPYLMCGFPSWWLGAEDGRRLFPGITPNQWDILLRDTGFSGVDEIFYDRGEPSKHMCSVMLSQATDDQVAMLRQPLLSITNMPKVPQLLIVGGQTLEVSRLANEISELLEPWKDRIMRVDSLESLDPTQVSRGMTLLSLAELDQPIFEHFTDKTLQSLQKLFDCSKSVLWLTRRCRIDNPYSHMTLGLARVLRNELTYLTLQMLDIDGLPGTNPGAKLITEALLRILMKDNIDSKVLWSTEPELALEKGTLLVPRICLDKALNNRWISNRRAVQTEVSTNSLVIGVSHRNGSYELQQGRPLSTFQAPVGSVKIKTDLSSLYTMEVATGLCLHLCLGTIVETGRKAIAFTTSNSSVVHTREDWVRECKVSAGEETLFLRLVTDITLARNILSGVPSRGKILIHQPEPLTADRIAHMAAAVGVKVVCTTTKLSLAQNSGWTDIHPFAPLRQLKSTLPMGITNFVNFSTESDDYVHYNIRALISPFARESSSMTLFPDEALLDSEAEIRIPGQRLEEAITKFTSQNGQGGAIYKIAANDIEKIDKLKERTCIIDWSQQDTYLATIESLNPRELFSSDKTYILFGLTGETGQSLARWMILNGVRNIVLTSRRGNVAPEWIEDMRDVGANVRVFSMDITDKEQLTLVHEEIVRTMPPIAGVVNGAMVLSDALFEDMTFKVMTDALGPKVEGSKNLDALFRNTDLDFFIMFSSVSNINGYRGQSNYSAANMFMTGLAARRRQKGLAASVLAIGVMSEIGYISRAARGFEEYIRKQYKCIAILEPDFHQMFAEAVLAGRPDSQHQPEIITGHEPMMKEFLLGDRPSWFFDNPRFWHSTLEDVNTEKRTESADAGGIAQRLSKSKSAEEAVEILRRGFVHKN